MTVVLMVAMVATPLALAALVLRYPGWGRAAAVLAPLPGLALWMTGETQTVALPFVLLGVEAGLDEVGRALLILSGLGWLLAGVFGGDYFRQAGLARRAWPLWLLTQGLNMGLILCLDAVSFMAFYAALGLVSWCVITVDGTAAAKRAGRIYLGVALTGEFLLFVGVVWLSRSASGLGFGALQAGWAGVQSIWVPILIIAAFGVKAALLPLHVWLPLAHPVAPVPSSAVLSAVLVKTGVLGWWRFIGTEAALPGEPLQWWLPLGLAGAMLAALYGALQRDAKTVLAYSTVSQLGLVSVLFGSLLGGLAATATAVSALGFMLLHHALAKAALFLGVGVMKAESKRVPKQWLWWALWLPALALAGAPLTSGLAAKLILKEQAQFAGEWAATLKLALPLTGITSSLLLGRFLWLMHPASLKKKEVAGHGGAMALGAGMTAGWGALLIGVLLLPLTDAYDRGWGAFKIGYFVAAAWPIAVGGVVVWLAARRGQSMPAVPPGDLLEPAQRLAAGLLALWRAGVVALQRAREACLRLRLPTIPDLPADHPATAGIAVAVLVILLLLAV